MLRQILLTRREEDNVDGRGLLPPIISAQNERTNQINDRRLIDHILKREKKSQHFLR